MFYEKFPLNDERIFETMEWFKSLLTRPYTFLFSERIYSQGTFPWLFLMGECNF